ncbi:MAG: amidohydrolase [Streptosporangiaceae bacterium]
MGMALTNARVYTSDQKRPWADTVAFDDGVITYVGDRESWPNPDNLPMHDVGGRVVVPGLIDAHTHPGMVSQSLWHVRLPWTTDVGEILRFIRDYARAHPPAEVPFLYFEYYPTEIFAGHPPTRELLDSAISDRPCLVQNFSEHEHWVNSRMLELMEVTRETPDPVPGLEMFVRDEDGEPTGLLREMVHRHFLATLYRNIDWEPPEDPTPERIAAFFRFMTEHGVTALLDALVEDERFLASCAELDRAGQLNIRYEGALRFRGIADLPAVIATLRRYQAKYSGRHINVNTVKLFLDGTNESGNSAVLAPMSDHPERGYLGEIGLETAELAECLLLCDAEAVDVHIHLVGDRAFRVACDAAESARRQAADAGRAWRSQITFAHCELIDPADMSRPAALGIVVNWTAHWSGAYFGEGARKYLGAERWNRMYRFNEVAQSGALVTFSSDVVTAYELHRANPLFGMQVAHLRVDPEYPLDPARYPGSVRPEESARLSRELLLAGYTINAARQLRLDKWMGSLEVGKAANLSVLSDDPLTIPADRLAGVTFDAVIFEGTVVAGSLPGDPAGT